MNILKNNDTHKKMRAVRLIAVCLIGTASIGLSAFSMRLKKTSFTTSAATISGTWKASIEVRDGKVDNIFVFKVDGNELWGTVTSGTMRALPISEGKIDGDHISFSVIQHSAGRDFKMRYTGIVNGNEMKLTLRFPLVDLGSETVEMIAKRVFRYRA